MQGENAAAGRPGCARAGRPAGAPPAAQQRGPAAGFLRLVRAVNGTPTRRLPLPHAAACRGQGREKPGLLRLGKYVQEAGAAAGRPGEARAGRPAGAPPAAQQRGPAAGFLRLVRAVNGAPTRRLPLPPRSCLPRAGPLPGKCRGTCKRGGSPANRPPSFNFRAFFLPDGLKPPRKRRKKIFVLRFLPQKT